MIKVWRWEDAPKKYRKLSKHRGDEDWVAYIPTNMANDYIGWMESGTPFGCAEVSEHILSNGAHVVIGAHS